MTHDEARVAVVAQCRRQLWAMWRAHQQDPAQQLPAPQVARLQSVIVDLMVISGPGAAAAGRGVHLTSAGNAHRGRRRATTARRDG
jgi:hypothetical protein